MKRFESLEDPDINKKFIKQYILIHKTGNDYAVDKSEFQYDYVGEIVDSLNEYVSTFFSNDSYSLDVETPHQYVTDIDTQLNDIENSVSAYQTEEITDFHESVDDSNNFGILLKNPDRQGYYSERLIEDIESDLLDENIVAALNEKKNEILNND